MSSTGGPKSSPRETGTSVTFVLAFQEPFQSPVNTIPVKLGVIHGTEPETDQHTPEPLSGAIANIRVVHNVLFNAKGKGSHHLQNTARTVIQKRRKYAQRIQNGEPPEYSKTVVPTKTGTQEEPEQSENSGDVPYVISPDEFDELDGYTAISLTYFADGVLSDENGVIISRGRP